MVSSRGWSLNPLNQVKAFGQIEDEKTSELADRSLNPLKQVKAFGLRGSWGLLRSSLVLIP